MMRWLTCALALAVSACDPFLALKATSIVQPTDHVSITVESFGSLMSGTSVVIAVTAFDAGGNVITGKKTPTWTVDDETVVTLSPASDGTVVATGGRASTAIITVTVEGKTAQTTIDVVPGQASQLALVSGGGQVGVVGDAMAPVVVAVTDAWGNPTGAGSSVQFSVPNGALTTYFATTNSQSQASTTWTPGSTGNVSITAYAGASASLLIPQSVTTVQVTLTTQPTSARSGIAISPAPMAQLRYASTGAVYNRSGRTVQVSITTGSGATVTGTSATTGADGSATFSNLVITGTAGSFTLRFTASTYSTFVNASQTTLVGGVPTKMTVSTQPPTSAITGQPFSLPVVVQLQDAQNNASPTAGVSVQAAATSFTLANSSVQTDATGKATFTSLSVSGTPGQFFTLQFSATSLTGTAATSRQLTGPATKLIVEYLAGSLPCDAVLVSSPRVRLQDAGSRIVSQAGVVVNVAISGTATIQSGFTATTDTLGEATFTNFAVRGTTGTNYTVTFSSTGLTPASQSATGAAGARTALAIVTPPPGNATNGVAITSSIPQVRLVDACNNTVTNYLTNITASTTGGGVTFTNGTRTTSNGVATFTSLFMAGKAQSYTLRFTADSVAAVNASAQTVLGTGAAAQVALTTEPPTTAKSDTLFTVMPVARIRDVGGNPVAGPRTVTASIALVTPANGATITAGVANSAPADSTAAFAGMKIRGVAGNYLLIFSSPPLKPDTAIVATTLGGGGTASKMVVTTEPSGGALPGYELSRVPVIQLRDVNDVNVALSGWAISPTHPGTGFGVNYNAVVTDATGKITFTGIVFSGVPTQPALPSPLRFSTNGLTPVFATTNTAYSTQLSTTPIATSGAAGVSNYYGQVIPAGKTQVVFTLTGAQSANARIYAKRTDLPVAATGDYSCAGVQVDSNNQTCTVSNPTAGQWFVVVTGVTSFTGTTIRAVQTP